MSVACRSAHFANLARGNPSEFGDRGASMRSAWPDVRSLRIAVDRQRLLIQAPLDLDTWGELLESDALTLATPDGSTITARRRGRLDREAHALIFDGSDQGLWLQVRHPSHVDEARGQFHAEMECQGLLCSTSQTGIPAVLGARDAVTWALYGHGAEAARALTFPGRTDVAIDSAWSGERERVSDAIEELVFARGHQDEALAQFVTRARKRRRKTVAKYQTRDGRMEGSGATGRTIYWGKNPQNLLYEKDREDGRDWPLVAARLTESGWNGTDRVTRYEARWSREFFHNNTVEADEITGERVKLSQFTFDQFIAHLPTLVGAQLARFRHTRGGDATRTTRARMSPLWAAQAALVVQWHADLVGTPWKGAGEIKAFQRAATLERATKHFERALVRMQLSALDAGLRDIAWTAAECVERGEGVSREDELRALQRRTAAKLDIIIPHAHAWRRERTNAHGDDSEAGRGT